MEHNIEETMMQGIRQLVAVNESNEQAFLDG